MNFSEYEAAINRLKDLSRTLELTVHDDPDHLNALAESYRIICLVRTSGRSMIEITRDLNL